MNKLSFFALSGFLFSFSAIAQPTITSASYLRSGSSVTFLEATASSLDTSSGINVSWDFSTLTPDQSVDSRIITYVDPSGTPSASSFPNANLCYREQNGQSISYSYFTKSADKLERIGSRSATGSLSVYSNPQTELVFPFTFGVNNIDEWANSVSSFGGTTAIAAIGYGTLKLPGNKIYNDIQLMRTSIEEFLTVTAYYWMNKNGEILAYFIAGDGLFTPISVRYATSITSVSVKEVKQSKLKIQYTNPVGSICEIKLPEVHENLTYTLRNVLGQVVVTGTIAQDETAIAIDMTSLNTGIFYFEANGKFERIDPVALLKN